MNKAHSPINWQNKPSVNTPINETNLNKMDSTIGILDDRIIEQDTSKLDKSTAYTMVKDISFNDNNGVFTVTRLNGSTFTIDTRLEKIAINFKYDYYTQKLIVTLIDGTTQSIDMSALLTQYEFTDSDTIGWEVAEDGTVKAKVLDGSITEDMLQPNYLADIKVETAKSESYMNSAKTSEINASSSANLAQSYAVGGTGTRDGEDTDNAKYYSENAQPLAQTITGTNPTATNSTNAPLIYGKFGGYTLQDGEPTPDNPIDIQGLGDSGTIEVRTCGKNLFNPEKTIDGQMITWDTGYPYGGNANYFITDYIEVKPNTTYTVREFQSGSENWYYDADKIPIRSMGDCSLKTFTTPDNCKYIRLTALISTKGIQQIELGDTATDLEPYTETTASIPIDSPLYDGDYIEVYADGSGKLVRKMTSIVFDGSEEWTRTLVSDVYLFLLPSWITDITWSPTTKLSNLYTLNGYYMTSDKCFYVDLNNVIVRDDSYDTVEDFKSYLQETPLKMVYSLATPTEESLTAEQVEAFKQLYTFDNITNVSCDGEIAIRYYRNTDGGDTVGMLQKEVSEFNKIVGGTVDDTGTDVTYYAPTEISDGALKYEENIGGTLVDALRNATSKISEFFNTLIDFLYANFPKEFSCNSVGFYYGKKVSEIATSSCAGYLYATSQQLLGGVIYAYIYDDNPYEIDKFTLTHEFFLDIPTFSNIPVLINGDNATVYKAIAYHYPESNEIVIDICDVSKPPTLYKGYYFSIKF